MNKNKLIHTKYKNNTMDKNNKIYIQSTKQYNGQK